MSQTNYSGKFDERAHGERWTFHQKVFVSLLLLLCGLSSLFLSALFSMNSEQKVSGQVLVTSDWVEITPPEPLKPSKQSQEIVIDAFDPLVRNNLELDRVQFIDGTIVKPEMELVDQYGNIFVAVVGRYPTPSLYENGISGSVMDLPPDRVYTKVRVRSNKPFRVSRIVWHRWDGK